MDIIKILSQELNESHQTFTLFEQARYFYLRTCQLFQYDFRYLYGDQELRNEIYNDNINLHKIENFNLVCSTWSLLYQQLLESIGIKSDILICGKHQYITFSVDGYALEADATRGADMSRVKMGHKTRKFLPIEESKSFEHILHETDVKLGYLKQIYTDECVKLLSNDLRVMYKGQNEKTDTDFNYEILLYKFQLIENIINMSTKISGYYDSNYYMSYLLSKLLTRWEWNKVLFAPCYQFENNNWDIVSLIRVEQEETPLYFYLHNINKKYRITDLKDDDRKHYVKAYDGNHKHLFI